MQKVEQVKRPLKIGEKFIVPCIVDETNDNLTLLTPVINHPHTDIENGQKETHYHIDSRFYNPKSTFLSAKYSLKYILRPEIEVHGYLDYFVLPVVSEVETLVTPSHLISHSKLKHKCIHKGKCPHRGMDLSQVAPKDGVIRCPLHGLVFHEKTGKLLTRRYDENQLPRTKK